MDILPPQNSLPMNGLADNDLARGTERSRVKPPVLPEFIAFSNWENTTKTTVLAAKVACLYQHTCYIARYLGSYIIFWLIFQCLAANCWEELADITTCQEIESVQF